MKKICCILLLFTIGSNAIFAQNTLNNGKISGNLQLDAQYYIPDSTIGENLETK